MRVGGNIESTSHGYVTCHYLDRVVACYMPHYMVVIPRSEVAKIIGVATTPTYVIGVWGVAGCLTT